MKTFFLCIFAFAMLSVFVSCNPMKKNVMKDIGDDVEETIIADSDGNYFLVAQEEVFQATSKSDKGGFRQITGYNENRITSYDLNTGQISKRIVLGEPRENQCVFLGESNGKLWYKSINPELGFHAREPKLLEVVVTQDKVIEVNPFLKNNLSQPEWNSVTKYYGFDIDRKMPMVSDNAGFVYSIDPVTLKAEKISESIKNFDYDNTCTSTSIKINANSNLYLTGSPRGFINYMNKELKDPSFLKGEFLKSSNILTPDESNQKFLAPYKMEIEKYQHQIDSINEFISGIDTLSGDKFQKSASIGKIKWAERSINSLNDRMKQVEDNIKRTSRDDNYEIITNDNCVFVMSQSDVSDKAKIIISKIRLNEDTTINLVWQTELKDVYREPDKGMDRSSFEVVFSKGSPNFRTMRAVAGNDKLIFTFMLKATCIDIATGKILWATDL